MNRRAVLGALDQLDAVAVRVAHEADPRALGAASGPVRRLLGLDALGCQPLERPLQVLHAERDVVVARAEVVGVDAVVVGQLEHRVLARQLHEHVGRLVADRHAPRLREAELLVERDGAVDVADSIAGVEVGGHGCNLPEYLWQTRRRAEWRGPRSGPNRRGSVPW